MTGVSEVKDATINGPGTAGGRTLNILYDADAEYQQTLLPVVTRPAKKTGLRSHRHHQHRRTGGSEPLEPHETPDPVRSSAVETRIQCVRVRARARVRVHSRASPGRLVGGTCVRSRVRARVYSRVRPLRLPPRPNHAPGQAEHPAAIRQDAPDSKEAWARSGAWPPRAQTGKARYLGPSVTIMPVDSYSMLGRSCEPAFKWIPDPGQARIRERAAR